MAAADALVQMWLCVSKELLPTGVDRKHSAEKSQPMVLSGPTPSNSDDRSFLQEAFPDLPASPKNFRWFINEFGSICILRSDFTSFIALCSSCDHLKVFSSMKIYWASTLLNLSWNTNLNNKQYSPSEYYPKQRLENYETETFYISLSLKAPFFLIPYLTPDFTMFN